jgi:hypothetical protein
VLTRPLLSRALLTRALLTRALLTRALLTRALLTRALLTRPLLAVGRARAADLALGHRHPSLISAGPVVRIRVAAPERRVNLMA